MWSDQLDFPTVRKQLYRIIRSGESMRDVVRVVPVAFPVAVSVFEIEQRVTRTLDLAGRFALDALVRFGPLSAKELDDVLGLGEGIITGILDRLLGIDGGIRNRDGQYEADANASVCLNAGKGTELVRQRHRFVLNGLDGTLLPLDFWTHNSKFRLRVVPKEQTVCVLDCTGREAYVYGWFSDIAPTGVEDIRKWLGLPDSKDRRRLGIPEGSANLLTPHPEDTNMEWMLAFVLVAADGSISVVPPEPCDLGLVNRRNSNYEYLKTVLNGESRVHRLLKPPAYNAASVPRWLKDNVEIAAGKRPSEVRIKLKASYRDIGLASSSGDGEDNDAARLAQAIRTGVYWDAGNREGGQGQILRLAPGCPETAKRFCVVNAVEDLQDVLKDVDLTPSGKPPLTLHDWWDEWQGKYYSMLDKDLQCASIPMDALVDEARLVPKTEFQEKLEWVMEA